MGKDPVSKTKGLRAAVDAELGFDPLADAADNTGRPARPAGAGPRRAGPDDSSVMADTKDGIITLAGHVHTWAEHDAVAGAALMARGAIDIRDDFRSPAARHRRGARRRSTAFRISAATATDSATAPAGPGCPRASGSGRGIKDIRCEPACSAVGGLLVLPVLGLATGAALCGQQCPARCYQ